MQRASISIPFISPTSLQLLVLPGGGRQSRAEEEEYMYSNLPNQYLFCPFAVETLGTFGEEALQLVSELGRRLPNTTGHPREKTWLIQRISVAIQRGNAASVLATIPPTSRSIDDFYYF
jgi:hypothetical protein